MSTEAKTEAGCTAEDYVGTFDGNRGEPFPFDTAGRVTYRVERNADDVEVRTPADITEADVVSSELHPTEFDALRGENLHAPCIDLDVPARIVESSTPGHGHLYIDVPMTWEQYVAILDALASAGVIEQGYYRASLLRRGTHLRLPWVRKPAANPCLEEESTR